MPFRKLLLRYWHLIFNFLLDLVLQHEFALVFMHNVHKDTFSYSVHNSVAGPYIYSKDFVERADPNWRRGDSEVQALKYKALGIMSAGFSQKMFSQVF